MNKEVEQAMIQKGHTKIIEVLLVDNAELNQELGEVIVELDETIKTQKRITKSYVARHRLLLTK